MSRTWTLICAVLTLNSLQAASLKEATFTQVINDVKVVAAGSAQGKPAAVKGAFKTPDVLRTGPSSLAELEAPDQTLTRVGANTVFAFEQEGRTIRLEQGSILFHSPKGKGGGTIKSGGASAAVLGTTLLVIATLDGGFKAIILEGRGRVTLPNGASQVLNAGQMIFVSPRATQFGPVLNVDLNRMVEGSKLVNGFATTLPSMPRIAKAIVAQARLIRLGRAETTQLLIGSASGDQIRLIDATSREAFLKNATDLRFQLALRRDATFSSEINPLHLFLKPSLVNIPGFGQHEFLGAAARILTLPGGTIEIPERFSRFEFLAGGDLVVGDSIVFTHNSPNTDLPSRPIELHLSALKNVMIPMGTDLDLSSPGNLTIRSRLALELSAVAIDTVQGKLTLSSGGAINAIRSDLEGSSLTIQSEFFNANGTFLKAFDQRLAIHAGQGGIQIENSSLRANQILLESQGETLINNSNLSAEFTEVRTFDNIKVIDTIFSSSSAGENSPSGIRLLAKEDLSMLNSSFQGISAISMDARTLVLKNVTFPSNSSVDLKSETGLLAPNPNTNQSVVPGHVNFIENVRYGQERAENFVGVEGPIRISRR